MMMKNIRLGLNVVLPLMILTLSCNAENVIKSTLDNNPDFNQVEKDVDACEVGKTYYEVCSPYDSGYDNTYYSNSWYENDWSDTFESNNNCPYGEKKVSLGWLNKEHSGHIRLKDIKECMKGKGYTRGPGKWIKNKESFVYFKNQWISPEEYIRLHNGTKRKLRSIPAIPFWESRIYPRDKCTINISKGYRCDENGEYYQGNGEHISSFFFPNVIIKNLSKANFSVDDIEKYLAGDTLILKTPKVVPTPTKDNTIVGKTPEKETQNSLKIKNNNSIGYIGELREIKNLLDSGIINQDEFQTMKKKIINRL